MREFKSLLDFSTHLAEMQLVEQKAQEHGLELILRRIQNTAKAELGNYQPAVGPFAKWAELAESTKADRLRQGYSENDPGYRSGAMEESIGRRHSGMEGEVGSDDDHLVYFEFGTSKQPARPVLGPAAYRNKKFIERVAAGAVVSGFIGEERIHPSLGYDIESSS